MITEYFWSQLDYRLGGHVVPTGTHTPMSVGSNPSGKEIAFLNLLTTKEVLIYIMKKNGGSDSTIIIGPSKSVLVYALHSLEKTS